MTKILATGDWHVGSGLDYGSTPADRLADQEHTIEKIVDLAIEHDVDVVLIAGDIWHRRRPTPAELLAVARPLRRLRAESTCDIAAIAGNHCVEHTDLPIALELFEDLVDVYRHPEVLAVRGAHVAMLPWTSVGRLVAAREGGDRDYVNREAAGLLVAAARGLRAQIPGGQPAILMAHWSVSGASTPTGALTDDFREVVLDLDELIDLEFDAVVLGHIHRHQVLCDEPWIGYVGSPAPVDFGEADVPHGCVLLELSA